MTARTVPAAAVTRFVVASRYMPVYLALILLVVVAAIWVPETLSPVALSAIAPFGALLAITALGQMLVIMTGGIDLSTPGTVTLAAMIMAGVGEQSDSRIWIAILAAVGAAALIGLVNGILIGGLKLNALIVTLATGQIVVGIVSRYVSTFPVQSAVPLGLSDWATTRILGVSPIFWIGVAVTLVLIVGLRYTSVGRRFQVVGANPVSSHVMGVRVTLTQTLVYVVAAVLYAIAGVALAATAAQSRGQHRLAVPPRSDRRCRHRWRVAGRRSGQSAVDVRRGVLSHRVEPDDAVARPGDLAPVPRVRARDHRGDADLGRPHHQGRRSALPRTANLGRDEMTATQDRPMYGPRGKTPCT